MNKVKVMSVMLLILGFFQAKSQETAFKTPDKPAKCNNIKNGKFLRSDYPEGIWYMTIKGNIQTEYFNNGKDYVKSTLVFVDDCNYKAIVIEKSDKSDPVQPGMVYSNKIVETEKNLLKVQTSIEKEQFEQVLIKVN